MLSFDTVEVKIFLQQNVSIFPEIGLEITELHVRIYLLKPSNVQQTLDNLNKMSDFLFRRHRNKKERVHEWTDVLILWNAYVGLQWVHPIAFGREKRVKRKESTSIPHTLYAMDVQYKWSFSSLAWWWEKNNKNKTFPKGSIKIQNDKKKLETFKQECNSQVPSAWRRTEWVSILPNTYNIRDTKCSCYKIQSKS